jgi:hypothetical protein
MLTITASAGPLNRWRQSMSREWLAIALVAVGLRVALCLIATHATHTTFYQYAGAADGYQYLAYARGWEGDTTAMEATPLIKRLFPGFPALIAFLHLLHVPFAAAALLPSWLAAGFACVLALMCFHDKRVGWGMATLTPAYVFAGSLICTEAACLLFSLLGVWLSFRRRWWLSGLAFGIGGLFRPVTVFAMLGCVVVLAMASDFKAVAKTTIMAGTIVFLGFAAVAHQFGDGLMTVKAYTAGFGGQIYTWPFHSIIATVLQGVPIWKLFYVGANLAAVLLASGIAVARLRRPSDDGSQALQTIAAIWLLGNTLNSLCLGDMWGFHDFPRFLVPALPAMLWFLRGALPKKIALWVVLGLISLVLSFAPARQRLDPPPPVPAEEPALTHG